jgi:hypothetical protein
MQSPLGTGVLSGVATGPLDRIVVVPVGKLRFL